MSRARPLTSVSRPARGEAGSAYILVLLVLVVLTIMALSLAFMTQTEVQIGANERVVTRVFYAADSGLDATISHVLGPHDYQARTYVFNEPGTVPGLDFKSVVEVSPAVALEEFVCDLCGGAEAEYDYQEIPNKQVTHGLTVVATRYAGSDTTPLAQKTLGEMFELVPWPSEIAPRDVDPGELAKIKF